MSMMKGVREGWSAYKSCASCAAQGEYDSSPEPHVNITEAPVGGGVGNPRGFPPPGAGPGSARGRDSLRRPPARGRHSLPGVGPTHFGFEKLWLRDDTYILRSVSRVKSLGITAAAKALGVVITVMPQVGPTCPVRATVHLTSHSHSHDALPRRARGRGARGRRPGVGTHPASGLPGVGPGSGLTWAPPGPGTTFTMSPRGFPTPSVGEVLVNGKTGL